MITVHRYDVFLPKSVLFVNRVELYKIVLLIATYCSITVYIDVWCVYFYVVHNVILKIQCDFEVILLICFKDSKYYAMFAGCYAGEMQHHR